MRTIRQSESPSAGNALLVALLVVTLLIAFAAAQFAVVQKNIQASSHFLSYSDLHKYAEGGLSMAIHDLGYGVTGTGGKIGTEYWSLANDVGADGVGGTGDLGEGDGIPTYGEPNIYPVAVGTSLNALIFVYTGSTAYPGVFRVVSTATSQWGSAIVDTYVRRTIATLPRVASVFVSPDAVLDLKGNSFLIDGNDHNPDGTPGPGPAVAGIATLVGTPPGANQANFLSQISSKNYDQILGAGGMPSLSETTGVDLNTIFETFQRMASVTLASGTYANIPDGTTNIGNWAAGDLRVTYANGDLHFSGKGQGAGVLLVDGTLTVTGQFTYYGVMIVRGDIRLSGGGAGVHTYGTVMVGQSITAIDPEESEVIVSGTADLFYSSAVLARLEDMLAARYSVVYYDER